ncbi:MAG TPA: patatin-like phospholipase family protein [Gemmatimonadales bacterium]|jgi:NTE family protein
MILAPWWGVRYALDLRRGKRVNPDRPFTLVLSGGGLKGLAHIGVLRALEEHGLVPSLVVGSSIGSLVGAAWASGVPLRQMEERARAVRRRDIFQVASTDVAFRRFMAPALYRREPLEFLVRSLVGDITFRELPRRLLVNTADLHSGIQVLWGLPGLLDTRVADAVVASCALPGIFPPRVINGRSYVDGAVVENLPVRLAASLGSGPIVAVNVASTSVVRASHETEGFAATYSRGLEIVMQTQIEGQLRDWQGPPLILVQPRVEHISMFAFDRNEELLEAGYRACSQTLASLGGRLDAVPQGMHPTRRLRVLVDDARCVGCGACVVQAPKVFRLDSRGKAEVHTPVQTWSPMDGAYVLNCPTYAISVRPEDSAA